MKHPVIAVLILFISLFLFLAPVKAQTETPPVLPVIPTGAVSGKLVNQSKDGKIPEKAELMVHVYIQAEDKGMFHGATKPDGTFRIEDVPLETGAEYLVMAVYQDVTYSSQSVVYKSGESLNIEVPIIESTTDASLAQVDQMHVLFNSAADGLEVKEIYVLSNMGDRTIKDSTRLNDNTLASFQFPLPTDADYIFFKPDSDRERFVKFPGGFADRAALLPGEKTGQFMVSYLLPFNGQKTYTYTAPSNIKLVDLLVPMDAGINLSGDDSGIPQTTALQGGVEYNIYSIPELQAGKTISLSVSAPAGVRSGSLSGFLSSPGISTGITFSAGILGLSMVVMGVWWAVKNKKSGVNSDEADTGVTESDFDALITRIALLDEAHTRGGMVEDDYREERIRLMKQAKELVE